MWLPDTNDLIGILLGLVLTGSVVVIWWKHRKPVTKVEQPVVVNTGMTGANTTGANLDYSQVVKKASDGTWEPTTLGPIPVPSFSGPQPSQYNISTSVGTPKSLNERYIDRDDLMKDIGAVNPAEAVILDGNTVHPGDAPALTYFTQADGSIADKPVAAGLKVQTTTEEIIKAPDLPKVTTSWEKAVPAVPYTPKVQVPLMDTSSSKYAVIMRGPTSIGFDDKVYNNFNELVLAFNELDSEDWRWQLVNIQPNYAFLNYLMDCFSGPVMYNFERAEKVNPKRDPNFNPDGKSW